MKLLILTILIILLCIWPAASIGTTLENEIYDFKCVNNDNGFPLET